MSPPPRCLSCERIATDNFGLCANCGGRTLLKHRTGDFGVIMPEVASAEFRQQAVNIAAHYFPGIDEAALETGLRKGRVRLVGGLSRGLADALLQRFAEVPLRGELVQGESRSGLAALARPLPLALGAVVAGAAYAAFPALIALDLAGGGVVALGGAAYLALSKNKSLVTLDDEDPLGEALRGRTSRICRLSADLAEAHRLRAARTLAAAGQVYRVLERDDLLAVSASAGSADGLIGTLDVLLDELLTVVEGLVSKNGDQDALTKALIMLEESAQKAQQEVDEARKTLAGVDLQTQIENELEIVRETSAAVKEALDP